MKHPPRKRPYSVWPSSPESQRSAPDLSGSGRSSTLANGRCAAHICRMADKPLPRLLEVRVAALKPEWWEWQVCESDTPIMTGHATSRETAQIDGDNACLYRKPYPSLSGNRIG